MGAVKTALIGSFTSNSPEGEGEPHGEQGIASPVEEVFLGTDCS